MDKKEEYANPKSIIIALLLSAVLLLGILFCPQSAFAADSPIHFGEIIGQLRNVVTFFLLPLAIVWVSWKLLYLAVVVGLIGFDPLHMVSEDSSTSYSYSTVTGLIKKQAIYFVKGICWIGGIFIIFQVVVIMASTVAGVFGEAFG